VGKRTSVYQSDPAAAPGIKSVRCKLCISTFRTEEEARNNHLLFQTHIFEPDNVYPAWKPHIRTPPATVSDACIGPRPVTAEIDIALGEPEIAPPKPRFACHIEVPPIMVQKHASEPRHNQNCKAKGFYCSSCNNPFVSTTERDEHCHDCTRRPVNLEDEQEPLREFRCCDCDTLFATAKKLIKHVKICSYLRKPCYACGVEVLSSMIKEHAAQLTHIQKCKTKGFYCSPCDRAFFSAREQRHHRRNCNGEPITCSNRLETPFLRSLGPGWGRAHEGPSVVSIGLPIYCEACRVTVFPSILESHVDSPGHIQKCKQLGSYCKGCRQPFFRTTELQSHLGSCVSPGKRPEREWTYCEACDDMIDTENVSLHRHHIKHIEQCQGEGLFCTICLVPFFSEQEMALHAERNEGHSIPACPRFIASRTRPSSVRTPVDDREEENAGTPAVKEEFPAKPDPPTTPLKFCIACSIEVPPKMIEKHAVQLTHIQNCKVKGFYCSSCGSPFFSATERDEHRRAPDCKPVPKGETQALADFRCCDCDTSFATSKKLNKHLKFCRSVPRVIFNCEPCKVHFSTRKGLISHLIGTGHKPVKCLGSMLCKRSFRYFAGMISHLESGACVSKVEKQDIDRMVRTHDATGSITIKDASESTHSLDGIDETRFLKPPAAIVRETDGDGEDDWEASIYSPTVTSASNCTVTLPTPAGTFRPQGAWRHGGIVTPSSSIGTPSGVLTPASIASGSGIWTPVDGPSSITDLVFQLANPRTCATCFKTFSSTASLAQHTASPVHAKPIYHCPRDILLAMGSEFDGKKGSHKEKEFKALSALIQHIEAGACRGGNEGREKAVRFLEGTLAGLGFGGGRLLEN
jgi:hypothetical protein